MAILCLLVVLASPEPSLSADSRRDVSRYVYSDVVILGEDQTNETIDFGFVPKKGLIGDFVWNDSNKNGIQDEGEDGLPGVNVTLYILLDGSTEIFFNSTFSDIIGKYSFEVPFGIYKVKAGEGQEYKDVYIRIDDPTIPEHIRNYPWGEIDKLYAGDPKNDSNDHGGTIVVLNKYDQINTTIDFGYRRYG